MTSYHGGKKRTGKDISATIYEIAKKMKKGVEGYCEPFCGMLGVYQYIPSLLKQINPNMKFFAGDLNKSVILMWKESQKGWIAPVSCTEEHFEELRWQKDLFSAEKGFIGHQYSFGGQYFLGFVGKYGHNTEQPRASRIVKEFAEKVTDVKFKHCDYKQFSNLTNCIIYCDPPYTKSTQKFQNFTQRKGDVFNSDEFWKWCVNMSKNNLVFVSEYSIPDNIEAQVVYEKKVAISGQLGVGKKKVNEKLFLLT